MDSYYYQAGRKSVVEWLAINVQSIQTDVANTKN